jgi:hypothetical protein
VGAGGEGSCPPGKPAGCVFLLSGGSSPDESYFVDASSNGDDVFFTTRSQLVRDDGDLRTDAYDARVGGGFPEVAEGSGGQCPGTPAALPPSAATTG